MAGAELVGGDIEEAAFELGQPVVVASTVEEFQVAPERFSVTSCIVSASARRKLGHISYLSSLSTASARKTALRMHSRSEISAQMSSPVLPISL
jgi:hypothetical protein